MKIKCRNCDKIFNQRKRAAAVFCDDECYDIYKAKLFQKWEELNGPVGEFALVNDRLVKSS